MAGPAAEAYIIMRADGTLLPRDVKDFAGDAGEAAAKDFSDEWDKELEGRQERSLKKFRSQINKVLDDPSLFKSLQRAGESSDQTFKRLTKTMGGLREQGLLSDKVFRQFGESFAKYKVIEDYDSAVGTLGRSIRDLTADQRKMFDADVKRAMTSYGNDWSNIVKKFGSVEDAGSALRARLRELTDANEDFRGEAEQTAKAFDVYVDRSRKAAAAQDHHRSSTGKLIQSVRDLDKVHRQMFDGEVDKAIKSLGNDWSLLAKKMGGVEETSKRLRVRLQEMQDEGKATAADAKRIQEAFDGWRAEQERLIESQSKLEKSTKKVGEANSYLQRELEKTKGVAGKALDDLIVKSSTTKSWSDLNHHVNDVADTVDHVRTRQERLTATTDAVTGRLNSLRESGSLTEETFRELTDSFEEYRREQQRVIDSMSDLEIKQERARVIHLAVNRTVREGHKGRDDFIGQLGRMGDRAGSMFGKNGRSDVLHYFGSLVGGIAKFALQTPAKIFNVASDGVKTFSKSFQQLTKQVSKGGAGMGKMPAMFSSMGAAASAMAPAIGAAVVAVVGFSAAAGALASFLSLLVGNLVILGQTLYLSVAAPLLALVPAIVSFGAGALVAGGAIYKWAQQSSAFKSAMSGISSELDKLAKKITPAMDGLSRLFGKAGQSMVRSFSGAVTRVLNDLYKKLDDPAMDKFYRAWNESMPRAFESLGKAASSFITGLTAFFVPILPYAERLAEAIRRAADRFSEWAKSASGQNAIASWMETAWQVAVDLWTGLKDIWVALRNIFGLATGSGGNFAEWVRDIAERFKEWTESEEGREAIKQWFEDAEELAKDFWKIVTFIGKAFDALDSPAGRTMLTAFMNFVIVIAATGYAAAVVMNAINRAVVWLTKHIGGRTMDALEDFGELWTNLWEGDLPGAVESGLDLMTGPIRMFTPWRSFEEMGTAIKDAVGGWFDGIDIGGSLSSIGSAISGWVQSIPGIVSSAGSSIASSVSGWFSNIDWGGIFSSIGSTIMNALNGIVYGIGVVIGAAIRSIVGIPKAIMSIDWGGAFSSMGSALMGALETIGRWTSEAAGAFVEWVQDIDWGGLWQSIQDGFSDTWDSISQWWSDLDWGEIGQSIQDGISDGLSSIGSWLLEQGSKLFDSFIQGVKDGLGIASPSQKMIELMGSVGEGILQGLMQIPGMIAGLATSIFEPLLSGAMQLPGRIMGALSTLGTTIWTALSTVGSTIGTVVSGWWTTISSNLMSWGGRVIGALSGFISGIVSSLGSVAGRIGTTVSGWWTAISGQLMSWGGRAIGALSGFISGIVSSLGSVAGRIGSTVSGWWSAIGGQLSSWGGRAAGALGGFVSSVISTVSSAGSRLGSTVSGWWGSIGTTLSSFGGKAKSALSNLASNVRSAFDSAKTAATSKAKELVSSARSSLSRMGSQAASALSNLASNVRSKFNSARSAATSAASNLVSSARSTLSRMGSQAASALSNLASNVRSKFNSAKSAATSVASNLVSSARSTLSRMGSAASSALSNVASNVRSKFNSAKSAATSVASNLVSSARSALSRMGSAASSALSNVASSVRSKFNNAKNAAVQVAGQMISSARSRLSGMASALGGALSNVTSAIKRPFESAKNAVDRILGQIRGLANKAGSIGNGLRGKIPGFAAGGTVFGNQIARVGETGAEAIVPLNRPIHQVDPSVRWLSAIAQGKSTGGGTTVQSGAIQVVTPYANPELVANRVLDDLVANL